MFRKTILQLRNVPEVHYEQYDTVKVQGNSHSHDQCDSKWCTAADWNL